MKPKPFLQRGALIASTLIILVSLFGSSRSYTYKETAVPEPVKLSPRLQALFEKTKVLCFGRYAIEVPQEAQLIWGSASFPSEVEIISADFDKAKRTAEEKIASIKRASNTADIKYNGSARSMTVGKFVIMNMTHRRNMNFISLTHISVKVALHLSWETQPKKANLKVR